MSKANFFLFLLCAAVIFGAVVMKTTTPTHGCEVYQRVQKNECIKKKLDEFIAKKQIKEALAFMYDYINLDKNYYGDDCHGMVHYIGDKAFILYNKGEKFDIGPYSNICVYGFYHAFTSSFILAGRSAEARDFCLSLEKTDASSALGCYHGIGHGSVYDYNEDYSIKDPLQIIQKSVVLCKSILGNLPGVNECITGVYDGIGDVVLDPFYKGLSPEIIYGYCLSQAEKYKPACYENISHLVYRKTLLGFPYLVNFVMKDAKIKYKSEAIGGLSTIYIVDLKGGNIDVGITVCTKLPNPEKDMCLRNMAMKLGQDALVENKYKAVRDFCSNKLIDKQASESCYKSGIVSLFLYLSHDKLLSICQDEKIDFYKTTCLNQLNEY